MPSDREIAARKRSFFLGFGAVFALLILLAIAMDKRPSDYEKKSADIKARSAFTKVAKEVETLYPPKTWDYDGIVSDVRLPMGHRRMVAVYFSDADIDNGGFDQYYSNRFGCLTVPAIEAYEKAGQTEMVRAMKMALKVALNGGPLTANDAEHPGSPEAFRGLVAGTNFRIPPGFLDGVDVSGKSLADLDSEYYALAEKLPGAQDFDTPYPDGFVTWYYHKFPEEFVFPPPESAK